MKHLTWMKKLNEDETAVLIGSALFSEIISLDCLSAATQTSAIKTLQFLESLVEKGILTVIANLGKGYYQFQDAQLAKQILESSEKKQIKNCAKSMIAFFEKQFGDDHGRPIDLFPLYEKAGLPIKGISNLVKMAEYYHKRNEMEKAVKYYLHILNMPSSPQLESKEKKVYIDTAIGLSRTRESLISVDEAKKYLKRALKMAKNLKDIEREARISMIYGHLMTRSEEDLKKASPHYQRAWELAQETGKEELLKEVTLLSIDFLGWQGRIAEAVKRYEEVIGNLEKLPSDDITLRACCLLGWCFSICGQTARGIGLIKAVNEKAESLHAPRICNYSDIMAVMTLLEARYIQDADVYVERILKIPKDRLEYYVLWMALKARAYILFRRGDMNKSVHFLQRAQDLSSRYGWPLYRGSWNLECIRGIEAQGKLPKGLSLQSEIELLLKWPDIYMKGVALRYRAEELFKNKGNHRIIMENLNQSLDLLTQSGAKLEAAKTKNEIARVLYSQGEKKKALNLWKEAWNVMSPVNRKLFPSDLKKFVPDSDREDRILNTIVEVSNNLGAIRNLKELLDRVISLIMEFTGAERCGIFLPEEEELRLVASRNLNQNVIQTRQFKSSLRDIKEVVQSGTTIVHGMETVKADQEKETMVADWMICCPIVLKNSTIGAIYMDADKIESAITDQDLKLLRAINSQIAISIDNARAYEEVSRLKDRLKEETRLYRMDPSSTIPSGEIIGKSEAMLEVLGEMQNVAATDSAVLIVGETGVGKEMIASGIHTASARNEGPYIPVNLASLAENLIPSELFGHEKGAFTGAHHRRIGRLELAHEGTLFLDDVQTIPMDIQAKLLRAIEEKAFERVGGTEAIYSDFRLIAATNIPLEELVEKGQFRVDLFYRLNVFPIYVKPLRERKKDIPLLILHFLEMYKKRFSKEQIEGITETNMKRLIDYPWYGNVRELKHFIERAVILSQGTSLTLPSFMPSSKNKEDLRKHMTMKEMERHHIISTLEKCGWKVSGDEGAAKLLDLKPQTLYSKMRRLRIKRRVTQA